MRITMANYTKQDIYRLVEEEDVEFIRLQFVDSFGALKNIAMTANHLDRILENRVVFDGAAIQGYDTKDLSEFILAPDLDTFTIFPWRPQRGRVARFICDVLNPDGTPYEADPRRILKNVLEQAEKEGYTFNVGPENEFFLFDTDEDGQPTTNSNEKGGFFDIGPLDSGENARRDMVLSLEEMGFVMESSYHSNEVAQHHIDFMFDEGLRTADNIMTFKLTVRTVAKRHGLHATFMPKPKYGLKGSAMSLNMFLCKDGKNIFADPDDVNGLSEDAYHFIGGLLAHSEEMAAITNPLVNSYKRLVPGYDAPTELTWTKNNQNSLIRISNLRSDSLAIELRSPDASANPYLVFAVCIAAGLDGIQQKLYPTKAADRSFSESDQKAMNIGNLPLNLDDALTHFENSTLIQSVLGKKFCEEYAAAKKEEWLNYMRQVSEWEISQYLYKI